MEAAVAGRDWDLKARKEEPTTKTIKAANLLRQMATETHLRAGDPGMQFHTTINRWQHSQGLRTYQCLQPLLRVYVPRDDSACNLASFNLVEFLGDEWRVRLHRFTAAVRLFVIAMDVLVDMAGYPTEKITRNSHDFRPLGLGYANLARF